MKKDFLIGFPDDFRFSEEKLILKEDYIEQRDPPSNFDITFKSNKKCNISDNNPAIDDTSICKNCYFTKFAKKLSSVRKSKRKDFLLYQLSIRNDELKFLNELNDFLIDNEEYFNDNDFSITSDYKNYIFEILEEMTGDKLKVDSSRFQKNDLNNLNEINQYFGSQTLDVFISHSSSDKEIVENLLDILITSLRIDPNNIRCTSVEGYKLEGGVNTDERLKKEIFSSKVLIGIISKDSLRSHYVLFELGARWVTNLPFKPVVTTLSDYELLRKPLDNLNILNISIHADVCQLIEEISSILNVDIVPAAKYQKKIQNLIDCIRAKDSIEIDLSNDIVENEIINLSELSIKVLSELYNDHSGTLLVVDTFDGYALQTNNKSFEDNNSPRERANLEYTLNQLLECNFISARGTAGTVFGITKEGYNFIDSLK